MARPNTSGKRPAATESDLMLSLARSTFDDLAKRKEIRWAPAQRAVEALKEMNPKFKMPEALQEMFAAWESSGRQPGQKGLVPPRLNEKRTYSVKNYNEAKRLKTSPSVNIPLPVSLYGEKYGIDLSNAKVEVTFAPEGPVLRLIAGQANNVIDGAASEDDGETDDDEQEDDDDDKADAAQGR